MLKTRVLTAVVALPLLIAVILLGGWVFVLVVWGALLLGGHEYVRMFRQGETGLHPPLWLVWALIMVLTGTTWFDQAEAREAGVALLLIATAFQAVWAFERGRPRPTADLALAWFGGVYLGWLGSYLIAVRELPEGAYLTLLLYGCVAFTDSAAYFVGRQWGRHKMTPRVSPKKSWEGYAASIVAGPIFGALAGGLPDTQLLTWAHGAAIGLLIGILGTVGDLGISVIKRQTGVKDSGHLFPGHGGLLDRTDSVLVAAAVGYFYLIWFVI